MEYKQDTFEVGEIYEVVQHDVCGSFDSLGGKAKYVRYNEVWGGGDAGEYEILDAAKNRIGGCSGCFYISNGVFTKGYIKRFGSSNNTTMNLIEKAKVAMKGEPEKSFIKAGVMDVNENLTNEGRDLFLGWLLKTQGSAFKTEVIDPILKEEEAA